jgi:PadR family transcriptional regulator AphA
VARGSKSQWAILGVLTIKPSSGYDIKKYAEEVLGHFWKESYGNLYPVLKRMLEAGLVTSTTHRQPGKPDRIEYAITAQGEAAFQRWLAQPAEPEKIRSDLLLKLFFGRQLPPEVIRDHLERYQKQQQEIMHIFEAVERELDDLPPDPNLPYWMLTLRRGLLLTEARLKWADESLAALSSRTERIEE